MKQILTKEERKEIYVENPYPIEMIKATEQAVIKKIEEEIDELIKDYEKIPLHESADYITALNKLRSSLFKNNKENDVNGK